MDLDELDDVRREPRWYRAGKRISLAGCMLGLLYLVLWVVVVLFFAFVTGVWE